MHFFDQTCLWFLQLDNHRNQLIQVLYSSLCNMLVFIFVPVSNRFVLFLELLNSGTFVSYNPYFFLLVQLELLLSSGTVCLSIYSLVAGIFGMNIPYTWNENHGYMFKWVCKLFLRVNFPYKFLVGIVLDN